MTRTWLSLLLAVALLVTGCGGPDRRAADKPAATPAPAELPGGGRIIFHDPARRVVAFYGHPASPELGALGIGSPRAMVKRLQRVAQRYVTPRRPVLPALELLATTATADAGPDGLHRTRTDAATIRRYLRAARSIDALLILDIQPGRSDFLTEAKVLERWLREPDVGLALDPEWRMAPDEIPGDVIGSVDAREVVAVGTWLDDLTARNDLPQKLLLTHQFTPDMITSRELLRPYANVGFALNVDGFGDRPNKEAKYQELTALRRPSLYGFKLFFREDTGLMTPKQVLGLRPSPDVVVYE